MKKNIKITCIIVVCLVCAGMIAATRLRGGKPQEQEPNLIVEYEPAVDMEVAETSEITTAIAPSYPAIEPEIVAPEISTESESEPEHAEAEITISLTKPVELPIEVDADIHEKGEESEPPEPIVVKPQAPKPTQTNEPQGGDINEKGQMYFPGFGWITPGNGNQVTKGYSDGDINKQVGIM